MPMRGLRAIHRFTVVVVPGLVVDDAAPGSGRQAVTAAAARAWRPVGAGGSSAGG